MANLASVFQNTTFDVVDQNDRPWLRAVEIAQALGYVRDDSISRIFARNKDEFSEQMSVTVKMTVSGNLQHEKNSLKIRKPLILLGLYGAKGGTRTPTP